MKHFFIILACCIALAGCTAPRGDDGANAPAPLPEQAAEPRSPFEVVGDFRAALRTELPLTALFMLDKVKYGTNEADRVQLRMKKLSIEMSRDGYDFKPVQEEIYASCAAVIVQENAQRSGSPQYGVFYLIKREHGWKLSPEPGDYRKILELSESQATLYRGLETWFQRRRSELMAQDRDNGR